MRLPVRAGLLAAVLLALLPAGAFGAATLRVPSQYPTISVAVAAADDGDTIEVAGGEYPERVTVGKAVTIVGLDGAVITGAGAATADAVTVTAAGVTLRTLVVRSTRGPAVRVTAAGESTIVRSSLASESSDAVRVDASSAGSRKLVADSSIFAGGSDGAGVRVVTKGAPADDVTTIALRHVTIATGGRGLVLDAQTTPLLGKAGSIAATVDASIVHPGSSAKGWAPPLGSGNTVTLTFRNCDTPGVAEAEKNAQATVTAHGGSNTPDTALFGRALHLRADAPVIDKGGPIIPGESPTDIDGQPRLNGAATDIGADEFHNAAPKAGLTASTATPLEREPVTFTSTSADPDVGDRLTSYRWDFGDGGLVTTDRPTVSHAYETPGERTVSLTVVDRFGAVSNAATARVTVRDGSPPEVTITTPSEGARLRLNPRARTARTARRPRPFPLTVIGGVSDASGVLRVEVAITRRPAGRSKRCHQYTGRTFRRAACGRLRFVRAELSGDGWVITTRRGLRVAPGRYEVRARGTDVNGLTGGSSYSAKSRPLVRFRVR